MIPSNIHRLSLSKLPQRPTPSYPSISISTNLAYQRFLGCFVNLSNSSSSDFFGLSRCPVIDIRKPFAGPSVTTNGPWITTPRMWTFSASRYPGLRRACPAQRPALSALASAHRPRLRLRVLQPPPTRDAPRRMTSTRLVGTPAPSWSEGAK